MNPFFIIFTIYVIIMYKSLEKVKNDKIEILRFRDSIARFSFLQLAFSLYDYLLGRFDLISFLNKLMLSHIGVASFVVFKEYIENIKINNN